MDTGHPLIKYRLAQEPPLKQTELAEIFGVSKTTVSRWESGKRRIDHDLLPFISGLTGIAVSELRPDLANIFQTKTHSDEGSSS